MSTDTERRQQQVGLNESSYRRVNEGIVLGNESAELTILCECGRLGCNKLLVIARENYERVRANPRQFVIQPGHELLEAERVVEQHEAYAVVEKLEQAAEIAEQTDPRTPLNPL